MNIVYTFDDGYTDITLVSMLSLFENNKNVSNLVVYIIDCGISTNNINRIKELGNRYNRLVKVYKAIDVEERIPTSLEMGYWSLVCYVRLFFAEILTDLDRVLHIDCDTIVRGDLQKLYEIDLGENICAACYDCIPSPKVTAGFEINDRYYSNGLLLFDLKRVRNEEIEKQFIDYIVKKRGILPHLDQDVISSVLQNKILLLPAEYNVMSVTFALGKHSTELFDGYGPYYSQSEVIKAIKEPIIVHIVGYRYYNKPWSQPCYHPYNTEWKRYFKMVRGTDASLLRKKRHKYGIVNNFICWLWNTGRKIKIIRSFENRIEISRFRKKCVCPVYLE